VQLVGILVGLFGVGYWMVAWNPIENRNVLLLGFLSKLLGSVLGLGYLALGKMPLIFLPVLFFADIIYLPPFAMILRRLYGWPRDGHGTRAATRPIDSRAA
jgi:small multidrug resistance pump